MQITSMMKAFAAFNQLLIEVCKFQNVDASAINKKKHDTTNVSEI
jgi:hypothetical protein